jgi:hypothetical protein
VRITAGPAAVRRHAGKPFPVSGTVQRLTPHGWRPLAGAVVVTTPEAPDIYRYTTHGLLGRGTSDKSGRFSYTATARRSTSAYTYPRLSDYVDVENYVGSQVSVPTAGSIKSLRFALDAFHTVTARGSLHGRCGTQKLLLQYARPTPATGSRSARPAPTIRRTAIRARSRSPRSAATTACTASITPSPTAC